MSGFDLHDNLRPAWESQGKYAIDLFTEKTLEIIRNRDVDKPFFAMVSHLAPHTGRKGIELEVPNVEHTNRTYGYIDDQQRRLYAGKVIYMMF
jgi:Sulfatase